MSRPRAGHSFGTWNLCPRLYRPRHGRMIGGVCAGLALRYGMSATLVRVLFLASCLLPGPQIVLYLILWVLLPSE